MGGRPSIENGTRRTELIVVIQSEADLEGYLIVRDLAVFDMTTRLHHLEPANPAQCARSAPDGVMDRILNTLLGRACNLDDSVDVIGHPLFSHDKT